MRARPREINIFNMSLLDILCGALGAFCFMMLVTMPHYVPPGNEALLVKNREETQRLLREAEALRARMTDPAAAEELRKLVENLTAQLRQLEGQVNNYANENNELKAENDKLASEKDVLDRRIKRKKPFLVIAVASDQTQPLEIYVQDDLIAEGKNVSANPPFDPNGPWHQSNWQNDLTGISVTGRGVVIWISAESVANSHYKVYFRYAKEPATRQPTQVYAAIYGNFGKEFSSPLPDLTLTPERFWTFAGTINADDESKLELKASNQAERDTEWERLMKSPPPPLVVATATPAPPPAASAPPAASPTATLDMADIERRRREALERLRRGASPGSGTPSHSPQMSEEEARALRERLLRERAQPSASPAP